MGLWGQKAVRSREKDPAWPCCTCLHTRGWELPGDRRSLCSPWTLQMAMMQGREAHTGLPQGRILSTKILASQPQRRVLSGAWV